MRRIALLAGVFTSLAVASQAAAASWAVVSSPGVGALSAVSCTSATACTAVGTTSVGGHNAPLVERWNGSSWSIQPTPAPSGAQHSTLNGVSCPSRKFCVAVGAASTGINGKVLALVERWNGRRWSIQHTPTPRRARQSFLNSVSCTSAKACIAVGSGPYFGGPIGLFGVRAERWNGSIWSIQRIPTGPAGSALNGVSCTSRSFCTAVGTTFEDSNGVPLAEHWNGTTWTRQPIPATNGLVDDLSGIACTSDISCTAVGAATDSQDYPRTLAERWHITTTEKGHHHVMGKWSLQAAAATAPNTSYGFLSFLGVSCVSTTTCTAVGNQFFGRPELPDETTWAERWSGLAWSIAPTPAPPADTLTSGLNGVSCTSSSACIAVGFVTSANVGFVTTPGQTLTLTERYS